MSLTGKWYGFGRDPHFDAGLRALEANDHEGAAEAFRALLRYSKAHDLRTQGRSLLVSSLSAMARKALGGGKPIEAREALREAIELEPNYPDLWLNLAIAAGRLTDEATERGAVEKALELNAVYPRAWLYKAMMAIRAENFEGLEAALEHIPAESRPVGPPELLYDSLQLLFQTEGDEANVLAEQADTAVRERQFEVAAVLYRQAVSLEPGYADIRCRLGQALLELDSLEEAETHLRAAVQRNTRYAEAWAQLGICLKRQGRSDEAREAFATAYKLNPSHPIARLEREK